MALADAVRMWPTPKASAAGPDFAKLDRSATGISLATAVAMVPTPTVHGNYNRKGCSATSGDGLATVVGGQLNPTWVEWLMGWPLGWTDLKPLEMDKFRQWLGSH